MDAPNTGQSVRLLSTQGKGAFYETTHILEPLGEHDIRVRAVMTGVCRSDVDMMQGLFPLLPSSMHGHEGLGQVVELGARVKHCKVGDYVATRGEPAYADYYNCKSNTWVVVPEADPKYILEPVACAVNIWLFCKPELDAAHVAGRKDMLIIGSGFLAKVFHQVLEEEFYDFNIDVWGSSSREFWGEALVDKPREAYDIVVDLKDTNQIMDVELATEPLIILCSQKETALNTDLSNWLWKSATIKMPSPRAGTFYQSMMHSVSMIEEGQIHVDNVWTNCYNRETNWNDAFTDALNRPNNYGRGYIKWD